MGWDPDAQFLVPDGVYEEFGEAAERGAEAQAEWQSRLDGFKRANADAAKEWDLAWEGGSYGGRPLPGLKDALRSVDWGWQGQDRHPLGRAEGDGGDGAVRPDARRRRR